jgi:hypothetical protein
MTGWDIAFICFAFVGCVVLLSALAIFIISYWFEIRFTIGKDKGGDNDKTSTPP